MTAVPSVFHWTRLPAQVPVVRYFWRLFTSVRFALVLILLLAFAFSLGVVIKQVPQELLSFPDEFAGWIETEARPTYGSLTNLFFLLGLFDVFHAVWFRSLLILLFVAITVCTLNRFPAIYQSTIKAKPTINDGFLRTAKYRADFELPGGIDALVRNLKAQRFAVTITPSPDRTHIYADKYGWAKYCTFASHLGLLFFLFGGLMTNLLGYQRFLIIPDGMSQPIYSVYNPEQMQVYNDGFHVDYYEDGRPKDYYSNLIIYKGGEEVARGPIRVNTPMDYGGFRFHQNSFGPTIQLKIEDTKLDQVIYSEAMLLSQAFGNVPFEMLNVPTTDISTVVALTEGNTTSNIVGGTFITGGQIPKLAIMGFQGTAAKQQPDFVMRLEPGQSVQQGDLLFTFEGTRFFTGVVARNDPGAVWIWLASALLIPALLMTFWLARRRLWMQVTGNQVRLGGMADHFVDFQHEINELVAAVGTPIDRQEAESPRPLTAPGAGR